MLNSVTIDVPSTAKSFMDVNCLNGYRGTVRLSLEMVFLADSSSARCKALLQLLSNIFKAPLSSSNLNWDKGILVGRCDWILKKVYSIS